MGYLGCALSDTEAKEFLGRINKRGERKCIAIVKKTVVKDSVISFNEDTVCGKVFMSEGAHNRKCPSCKAKERLNEDNQIKFDIPVYKTYGTFKRMNAFRGEIE